MKIKSIQPALGELERALQWSAKPTGIKGERVVATIQSKGKRARCGGWFAPDQWSTREGQSCHEINFSAELLKEEPEIIVALAVHEIVHLWCHSLGLKDTAKSGRHNQIFKEYAEIMGLECADPIDTYGYGYTTAGPELAESIKNEFLPDVALFNLFRVEILPKPKTPKEPPAKWSCGCTEFRTKDDVMATCGKEDCGNPFKVVE